MGQFLRGEKLVEGSKCPSISVSIREDWPCRVQALNWAAELAVSPLAVCVGV